VHVVHIADAVHGPAPLSRRAKVSGGSESGLVPFMRNRVVPGLPPHGRCKGHHRVFHKVPIVKGNSMFHRWRGKSHLPRRQGIVFSLDTSCRSGQNGSVLLRRCGSGRMIEQCNLERTSLVGLLVHASSAVSTRSHCALMRRRAVVLTSRCNGRERPTCRADAPCWRKSGLRSDRTQAGR
jgi:hypothetical protein